LIQLLSIIQKLKSLRTSTKIKIVVVVGLLLWFWFSLPKKLFNAPTSYVIEDADGNLLNATIAADGQWRFPYNKNVPHHHI
jgi:penicillin-binding protein 1C